MPPRHRAVTAVTTAAAAVGRATLAKVVVGLILVAAWHTSLAPRSLGGPLSMIWVSGQSMEPTLYTGDLSILHRSDRYEVGDIVAFEIPEGGTVIHRVVEIHPDGYEFLGDNRDFRDPWILDESWIKGRQIGSVPKAAFVMTWLGQPKVMAVLVALLVLLIHVGRIPSRERNRDNTQTSASASSA